MTRIKRFKVILNNFGTGFELKVWRNAKKMINELDRYMQMSVLISLDHDLNPVKPGGSDPGDGLDVAKFLALRDPMCPVIIHSSNVSRSDMMMGELELGGWEVKRIVPIGDDWIEIDWASLAKQLIYK
ncbi:MAG: cyclic-phosphate processing receiver domain-containing protein [Sedimentisphaerales bacterium]